MTTLVTGGTGKTGARVARRLRELGHPVRVASRRGGDVAFDWSREEGFGPALEGVDRVYLVAPVGALDPYPPMAAFVERALAAGVRRFVLLSASSLPEGGPAMGSVHRLLRETALEWAAVRPSWFMQNFSEGPHRSTVRDEGRVYSATGAGRVPFVDADDIAEVAVRALVDPEPHNADHVVTGPETLSYGDAARRIGEAIGRPVLHANLSEAELATRFAQEGVPEAYARLLAAMDGAIERGSEDRVTDVVERVTGRPPRPFESFVRDHAAAWTAA